MPPTRLGSERLEDGARRRRISHRTLLRLGEVTALRETEQLERIVAALGLMGATFLGADGRCDLANRRSVVPGSQSVRISHAL